MFKIESYITPIILRNVEKYIKNIRPQDSQVSLWGGEVSFQNLDLRLDVLEEELQLPFNLLSGHIHEMIIKVPWTKIASEPISITINTIEFVMKLKSPNESFTSKRDKKKKSSRMEELQAPPGYMASLVNKIANNVSITCNNIILKYVEEDIVVSMNIQLLSFDSADVDWKPAFIDISPINVLMRKIINIKDLTICLDKRNSLGKIDICQEPVLYRCTFQVRMIRKYNSSTLNRSSMTRIDLHTNSVNVNISTQQFPMIMRLLNLALNLKNGTLKNRLEPNTSSDHSLESDGNEYDQGSYFSWAWNLIPSFFPNETTDEDSDEIKGHLLHTGIYIDKFKLTFKSQEIIGDPIVCATKKIKYVPFVKVILCGMYLDVVNLGTRWSNVKGGISSININPVGDCICGSKIISNFLLKSLDINENLHFKDTLIDSNENLVFGKNNNYNFSWETHLMNVSENELLKRTPAFAFDIIHQIELPDDCNRSSDIGSDLEYSNLSEKSLMRVFIGPMKCNYNMTLVHICETLFKYYQSYNYPPYVEIKQPLTLNQLTPPSTEDYDALMAEIPLCLFQVNIKKFLIEFQTNEHKRTHSYKRSHQRNSNNFLDLSFINLEIEKFDIDILFPIYPNRLVFTTCQLPDPPINLFERCYYKIDSNIKNLTLDLNFNNTKINIINIGTINSSLKHLIRPDLWLKSEINHEFLNLNINHIKFTFNQPQFHLISSILNSILDNKIDLMLDNYSNKFFNDLNNEELTKIHILLESIQLKFIKNQICQAFSMDIDQFFGFSYIPQINKLPKDGSMIIYGTKNLVKKENIISLIIQLPVNMKSLTISPIFSLKINEILFNFDPNLFLFFDYDITNTDSLEISTSSGLISDNESLKKQNIDKILKKIPRNLESIHSSSEKDTTTIIAKHESILETKDDDDYTNLNFIKYYKLYFNLIINIEIQQCTCYIPGKNSINNLRDIHSKLNNYDIIIIKLPSIVIISSQLKSTVDFFSKDIPLTISSNICSFDRNSFPWSVSLSEFTINTIHNQNEYCFIGPIKTNITLALTCKDNIKNDNENINELNSPICVFIHIDTTPTILNFYKQQIDFLYTILNNFLKLNSIKNFLYKQNEKHNYQPLEITQRPSSPDQNVDLKEFFGIANTSSSTKDTTITVVDNQKYTEMNYKSKSNKTSILIQWTVTKFSSRLYGCDNIKEYKLVIDCEDIISSIDKQFIYTKFKIKIGSISSEYYEKFIKNDNWILNESLGFNMKLEPNLNAESTNDTFFDLIITTAETGNVHSKWGISKRDKNLNNFLTEVIIYMKQIDFRIDFDLLSHFIPIFQIFNSKDEKFNEYNKYKIKKENKSLLSASTFPLIEFESEGFRIFIPTSKINNENCNVLILKVNQLSLSPNVDNPITRIPVRTDIYTKAAQLRLLNLRGSKIEDRQYEFLIKNISMATGSWKEVSTIVDTNTVPSILHENPAFEWNNKQNTKKAIEINTIFNNFNFSIVFAPSIIFKNVLVCGSGLELNCLTDLTINLNSSQIILGQCIYEKLNYLNELFNGENENKRMFNYNKSDIEITKSIQSIKIEKSKYLSQENLFSDSGIESQKNFIKNKSIKMLNNTNNNESMDKENQNNFQQIPFEMCFVSGIFSVNLYDDNSINSIKKTKTTIEYPLISFSIHQPNMMISRTIFETTIKTSIFDISINLGNDCVDSDKEKNQFSDILFKTIQGDLDSHGIPQSIVKIKFHKNILKDSSVDIEFKRPMKICFSHKSLEKLYLLYNKFYDIYTKNNKQQLIDKKENLKPISKNLFKMKSIIKFLNGIHRINFMMSQLSLQISSLSSFYDLKFSLSKFQVKLEVSERPEKIIFNMLLKAFMINTDKLIILHPLTLDIYGNLQQEHWNKYPSIFFALKSNYIQIDLGPKNILHILKVKNAFNNVIENFNKLNRKRFNENEKLNEEKQQNIIIPILNDPINIKLPKFNQKLNNFDEYYQDDLRAGAFQFIEARSECELPLPYQILVINKEHGLICWRYPQPRALHNVEVYPVPFYTTTKINIKCKLEYYSDAQLIFLPYALFELSESEMKVVDLPKTRVTASIWRVVMTQSMVSVNSSFFEEDFDDETYINVAATKRLMNVKNINEILQKPTSHVPEDYLDDDLRESIFHLHPRILIACMKVDSMFIPSLVPNLQSIVNISQIQINLNNQLEKMEENPSIIKNYEIINNITPIQTFLILNFKNLKLHTNIFNDLQLSFNTEFNFSSEILDYSFLTIQPFIEDYYLESSIEIMDCLNVNVLGSELKIRFGPSYGHTLAISEQLWKQCLTGNYKKNILISRFIICNETITILKFGQFETDERIYLKPKQCSLYAFRSEHFDQKLIFYVDENLWYPSESILINDEILNHINIDQNRFLIIKNEKISTTQKKITVKGQIEFMNMTMYGFFINYKSDTHSVDFELKNKSNTSVIGACDNKIDQNIRIKLSNTNKKGWSGEIPLQKSYNNNAPWLVKVPSSTSSNFVSFWIRVIREDLNEIISTDCKIQKVLVIIWPLYMIKSMLTIDIISNQPNHETILIPGRGSVQELSLPGTHEDEHELIFDMNLLSPHDEEKNKAILSYKLIDKSEFFSIPEKYDSIDKVIDELNKFDESKWPCSREEELRWIRDSSSNDIVTPIYNCSLSRELSCSLMLSITPWCLFINSTGVKVKLVNKGGIVNSIIKPNKIAMPMTIKDAFCISIKQNTTWKSSSFIYFNSPNIKNEEFYVLTENQNTVITIKTNEGVSKFVLSLINENGVKVLILSSYFVICNYTKHILNAFAYCVQSKSKQELKLPDDQNTIGFYKTYNNKFNEDFNYQGSPILSFFNLTNCLFKPSKQNENFTYFISLQSGDYCNYSCPINLSKVFNRKSLNILSNSKNVSISVSLIEHNSQMFLSIYNDNSPELFIENLTDIRMYVAQSNTLQASSQATAVKIDLNGHFDWYQVIEPKSNIFYTPPSIDDQFPDIGNIQYGLIFAVVNEDSNQIKWTIPIQIDQSKNVFLKMPTHGDLKLTINCDNEITNLKIEYISEKQEFCAKDIRSRLLNPLKNDLDINLMLEDNSDDNRKTNQKDSLNDDNNSDDLSQNNKKFNFNFFTKEISLTFFSEIDKKLNMRFDLISLWCDDVAISFNDLNDLKFGWSNFQVDNLRYPTKQYDFPVVLCPQEITQNRISIISAFSLPHEISKCFDEHSIGVFVKFYKKNCSIESFQLNVKPIRAYLEDTYLNFILDYMLESLPNNLIYYENIERKIIKCDNCDTVLIPQYVEKNSFHLSESFKLKKIKINPLNILLSVHTCLRMYIALDHSPLQFSTFERNNIKTLPVKLGYILGKHYLEGAAIGAGWVVGSLEILGSPGGLARSVTTGIKDFVSLPVQGLLRGPWGFLVGITQGSASLIRNITAGTVNSVTKLAASVSRNLDWLTLDEQHLLITDSIRRSRPQGITEGFAQGLAGLGISLLGAVGGLARHPLEAKSTVQVFTGVGKGIVGAFAKPISGAAELVALTGQGMLQSVGYNTLPIPRSYPAIKSTTISPASCKFPSILTQANPEDDTLLFTSLVTLKTKSGLKCAMIYLTTRIVALLCVEKDEILEIVSIDKLRGYIDENDSSLVVLKIMLQQSDSCSMSRCNNENRIVISPRTYEFVRESTEQLPIFSLQQTTDADLDYSDLQPNENEQKMEIYMAPCLAEYFIRYISLIKRCISPNRILFSPLERS